MKQQGSDRLRPRTRPWVLLHHGCHANLQQTKEEEEIRSWWDASHSCSSRTATSIKARTKIMVDGLDKSLAVSSTIVAVRMRPPNAKEAALDARSVFSTTAQPVMRAIQCAAWGKRVHL